MPPSASALPRRDVLQDDLEFIPVEAAAPVLVPLRELVHDAPAESECTAHGTPIGTGKVTAWVERGYTVGDLAIGRIPHRTGELRIEDPGTMRK